MTRPARDAPSWLADFQARFGAVLRTPLDRGTGTLRAEPEKYDPELLQDTRKGLDVYNRQYWFRLFDMLQNAYPLTARLLGLWEFNEVAASYFLAHPPRSWDLDDAPDGFVEFFARHSHDLLLLESAKLDAAWRTVFRAPEVPPFVPDALTAETQLVPSPAAALFEEHAPLSELRRELLAGSPRGSSRLKRPALFDTPRTSALVRREGKIAQLTLAPREAELLTLLREHPIAEALGRLEQACPEEERASLPGLTRTWLARSVAQGFWTVSHTRRS